MQTNKSVITSAVALVWIRPISITENTKIEILPVRHCRDFTGYYCITTIHWCELYSLQAKQTGSGGGGGGGVTCSNQNSRHQEVTWSRFHTVDPQILRASLQNVVATAMWRPLFVNPYIRRCVAEVSDSVLKTRVFPLRNLHKFIMSGRITAALRQSDQGGTWLGVWL